MAPSQNMQNALADIRANGREGRTIAQIAEKHGVTTKALGKAISREGLPRSAHGQKVVEGIANSAGVAVADPSTHHANSLQTNGETSFPTNQVGNSGNQGVRLAPGGSESEIAQDKEAQALKALVVRECRRLLRDAKGILEVKSIRDFQTVYNLAMSALNQDKREATSKGGALVQVNVLSSLADKRGGAAVKVATGTVCNDGAIDSGSESPEIE